MRRIRTILAVAKKDLTQIVRYPTWIIQLIIWPLIFPLIYILSAQGFIGSDKSGLSAFRAATGTDSYMGYMVIGTMAWMWVNMTMWSYGTYLREEQIQGTLESNWLCPIRKFDFLIGGAVVAIVQGIFTILVSILEYRFIYGIHFSGNILAWLLIFLIMMPGVYGLGTVFASLILWLKEANAAVNLARGLMMILCGISFPIAIMPKFMQYAANLIPFTHGIKAAREIMLSGGGIAAASNSIILCLIEGLILLIIGRLLFISIERMVKNCGSLERF